MSKKGSLSKIGSKNPMFGKRAATWKGGRKKQREYWLVWNPCHPLAQNNGYILEHRIVMMQFLGRLLGPEEIVHHKNHDKGDNRIENLQLMTKGEHISLHHKGKKLSENQKKSLSESMKNKTAWNKGKKFSLESRMKMSMAKKLHPPKDGYPFKKGHRINIGREPWNKGLTWHKGVKNVHT